VPLARIAVWLEPIAPTKGQEQPTVQRSGRRKLISMVRSVFSAVFSAATNAVERGGGGVTLACSRRSLK